MVIHLAPQHLDMSRMSPAMTQFRLSTPLPARKSADALRQQLIEHLVRTAPSVGERFLSDHQLVRLAKLSRPTVRRALDELQKAGWIERRQGRGTFVGPRAAILPAHAARYSNSIDVQIPANRRIVRLAILIHLLGELHHDWYARGVIAGMDEAATEVGISIELLGDRDGDSKSSARRLSQTRPDVVAFTGPSPQRLVIIGEAQRLGIHCIGSGTFHTTLGVPTAH